MFISLQFIISYKVCEYNENILRSHNLLRNSIKLQETFLSIFLEQDTGREDFQFAEMLYITVLKDIKKNDIINIIVNENKLYSFAVTEPKSKIFSN